MEAEELKKQLDAVYKERDLCVALAAHLADAISREAALQVDGYWAHSKQAELETLKEIRKSYFAWLGKHEDKPGEEWDEDWKNIVFIRIPQGQLSWHIHDSEVSLFNRLFVASGSETGTPDHVEPWDGHTTEEKYERIRRFCEGD